jgi:hypothetical protein
MKKVILDAVFVWGGKHRNIFAKDAKKLLKTIPRFKIQQNPLTVV